MTGFPDACPLAQQDDWFENFGESFEYLAFKMVMCGLLLQKIIMYIYSPNGTFDILFNFHTSLLDH